MAIRGSAAEVEKYLKGVDYPASKDDLLEKARANGAPDEVIEMINGLTETHFTSPIDVSRASGQTY
jgi:hypothetical protein